MAKPTKNKPGPADGSADTLSIWRIFFSFLAVVLIGGGAMWGYGRLRDHVEKRLAFPSAPPTIVLKNPPVWMNESVARQIALSIRPRQASSAMDHHLLENITGSLRANSWVRQVRQVRRVYGQSAGDTIEIDCEYRNPIALVANHGQYLLVDTEGFRLPETFPISQNPPIMFTVDGRINIRIIEGVAAAAPAKPGQLWPGQDLQAGLELVKFLYGKPMVEDIHRVNVANFGGRRNSREAQLVLGTRFNTEIRWGKPVTTTAPDEIGAVEKLERLSRIRQQFDGRVDAGKQWIDLRFDKVLSPAEEKHEPQANARP